MRPEELGVLLSSHPSWPVSRRPLRPATLGRETLWARLRISCWRLVENN